MRFSPFFLPAASAVEYVHGFLSPECIAKMCAGTRAGTRAKKPTSIPQNDIESTTVKPHCDEKFEFISFVHAEYLTIFLNQV